MTMIRADVVNLFYKGYISEEKQYAMVNEKKVDFGPDAINMFFGLDDNEIGHAIFKNPKEQNLQEGLTRVAWPGTKWGRMPTRKYQLFPHNLNTEVNWRMWVRYFVNISLHGSIILAT
ncbi:hypothetical protein E5676_scaffold220G00370 [Cucumis melo var. makuwa]|uniref:Uncharacterized protein n=1 Tax=Cucumis melo var. makuwa TaxID=1194695 RepID=A0A5D3BAR9_CUCMM|nr:hypothetical protein E5676_scaffold220G00370 [Cucumis melo var. makuwa]